MEPSVSVIIVSFEAKAHLRLCLDALATAGAHEVWVVDNASRDGSVALAENHPAVTHVVAWPVNRGFSAAVNHAAGRATGEYLLLLNPDAQVTPDFFRAVLSNRERHGGSVIGTRQVDGRGRFQLALGPGPSLLADALRGTVQRRLDRGADWLGRGLDRLLVRPREVPWVAGSCMLISRAAFEATGGFDPAFFLYFEDIDFCLRAKRAGYRVVYDPTVTVVHARGQSANAHAALAARAYRESQRLFWRKHRGALAADFIDVYSRWRARSDATRRFSRAD